MKYMQRHKVLLKQIEKFIMHWDKKSQWHEDKFSPTMMIYKFNTISIKNINDIFFLELKLWLQSSTEKSKQTKKGQLNP